MSELWIGMGLPWKGDLASLVSVKTDEQVIASDVIFLLFTALRERFMQPELGGGLTQLVFEPNLPGTVAVMEARIVEALARYEDRVTFESVDYDPVQNTMKLKLGFFRKDAGVIDKKILEQTVDLNLFR